jgi:DNA-binding NarL/FixJ family response regulator
MMVLDVMMPGVDGWQVLEELKSDLDPIVAEIPVVMLTARSDDLDRIRGSIEGAIRYLTKPFSPAELRDEVNKALEGDEPAKRRRAQTDALEELARLEGGVRSGPADRAARPHLTRLERPSPASHARPEAARFDASRLGTLSPKQRELLDMVGSTPTVSEAAERLAVSRSNVYASLRRIARKLDVRTVPELVTLVRAGGLAAGG